MHKINIEQAKYKDNYQIFLHFNDGKEGIIDLEKFVFDKNCGVFKELQNKNKFKKFALKFHTIVWNSRLDLAPEFLYDLLKQQNH